MLPSYYYQRRKRKKQRLILLLFLGTTLLLIALVLLTPQKIATPAAEILQQPEPVVLAKTATLKLSTLYACGHQRSRLFPLPAELESKNKEETALLHPDWTILRFEEELLEAEEKSDTDCDNHFLLKLANNKIVVFKKNAPKEIIMEEKINPSILTEEDREILSSGIWVNSEYELLEILESFR